MSASGWRVKIQKALDQLQEDDDRIPVLQRALDDTRRGWEPYYSVKGVVEGILSSDLTDHG